MTWCNNNNTNNNINITINTNITEDNINDNSSNMLLHHQISESTNNLAAAASHQSLISPSASSSSAGSKDGSFLSCRISDQLRSISCPCCGHHIPLHDHQAGGINDLPGLPAGVKFDPTDTEIMGHLEAKVKGDLGKLHPLLDEFIPTIEGENGICYTHPEKLPGVSKDGVMRHFFHCPSKAYTTGTRKRRKVHTDDDGGETRWHKTGKTRPILTDSVVKGFKKILVLYTNYGRQKKPEKTNWVMHQYHLGDNEEEKDGEFVLSKVFYQTQPRQCGSLVVKESIDDQQPLMRTPLSYYHPSSFNPYGDHVIREPNRESPPQLIPNLVVQGETSSFVQLAARK